MRRFVNDIAFMFSLLLVIVIIRFPTSSKIVSVVATLIAIAVVVLGILIP